MEYILKTKLNIGDSVYGFVDGEIHNLVIDRIEISFERFDKQDKYTNYKVVYLATTTDCKKFNCQHRFKEGTLFTEEEIIKHVNEYFKNRKNS